MEQFSNKAQNERRVSLGGALRSLFTSQPRSLRAAGFTLIELMVVVAIIGSLAAIGIPAMINYVRRSKTAEPSMNLRKMYDAAVMYYATDHSDPTGKTVPRTFPATNAGTPSGGGGVNLCCISPGGKCAPNPLYWEVPTWNALHFSVDDPFYFSYGFRSGGQDNNATFSAFANGDLDCDGVHSTFERFGSVNQGVVGSSAIFIRNDVE